MWPFSTSDDETCTAHHFDEDDYEVDWNETKVFRAAYSFEEQSIHESGMSYVDIEVIELHPRETAECQHKGCEMTDIRLGDRMVIPMSAVCETPSEAKDVHETIVDGEE